MGTVMEDNTYQYKEEKDSIPDLDDPSMQHWTDPKSYGAETKPPPQRSIEPLDEAMGNGPPRNQPVPGLRPIEEIVPRNRAVPGQPIIEGKSQYDPADTNKDGIVSEIERYLNHNSMTPEERGKDWVEQNVWAKGYTVDMGTGEIVDPRSNRPVGRLPSFE